MLTDAKKRIQRVQAIVAQLMVKSLLEFKRDSRLLEGAPQALMMHQNTKFKKVRVAIVFQQVTDLSKCVSVAATVAAYS